MTRSWLAGLAVLLTACATSGTAVCGGCPGSSLLLRGVPGTLRHAVVTTCVAGHRCHTSRAPQTLRADSLQPLPLPSGADWARYDGVAVRVRVRSAQGRWQGSGRFDYTPDDGGVCSCAGLVAGVDMTAATSRVSPPG